MENIEDHNEKFKITNYMLSFIDDSLGKTSQSLGIFIKLIQKHIK